VREWLGRLVKREMTQGASGLDAAIVAAKAFKEEKKLLSAPTIVVVYSDAGSHERETRENYAASCAAAQNVLLMAHQLGVAGIWRTSTIYELPKVREVLGAHDGALFVGSLFLGYSAQREVKRRRTPAHQKTHWLSAEDFEWLEASDAESQSGI
jgi:nitroreductase